MPKDDLDKFLNLCAEDSKIPLFERLKRAGYQDADLTAITGQPQALQRAIQLGVNSFLIPIIPGLIRLLAVRAIGGDKAALTQALALLGDKSPIKESGGMDLGAIDDTALLARAGQLADQLAALANSLGAKKPDGQ